MQGQRDQKGKGRASHRELEDQRELDDLIRHREEAREDERRMEHARICMERAPIPQHVINMQARDFEEHQPDSMASALHDQISRNVDLTCRCEELEKMLSKRQLSPDGCYSQSAKRQRDMRPYQFETHRRMEAEMDDYLAEGKDYPLPHRQWRERGRGGFLGSQGRDSYPPSRGRDVRPDTRPVRQQVDIVTLVPTCNQRLPKEDKHDAMLDSYDQRRFGGIIPDERISLEERVADLSSDLPAMPLSNGSYPNIPRANRLIADLIEGEGSSSEADDNEKPMNSIE